MSDAALLILLFIGLLADFNIGCAFREHSVINPGELMSRGRDCVLAAAAGFDAAIESAECGAAAGQAGGGDAKGLLGAISIAPDLFG